MRGEVTVRPQPFLFILTAALLLPCRVLATTAADICPPAATVCIVDRGRAIDPGSILDFGERPLILRRGVSLDVGPGDLTVSAASLTLEPGAGLLARGLRAGPRGGGITVTTTGDIRLQASGTSRSRLDVSAEQVA